MDAFEGDWKAALVEIVEEISSVQDHRAEAQQQLEAVQIEATSEADNARVALAAAQAIRDAAGQSAKEIVSRISAITNAIAQLNGELGIQREIADAEDEESAQSNVDRCATELTALPMPIDEIDEEDLRDAERLLTSATSMVRQLQLEVREAEGALGQTGGQYIEEQAEQAREAVYAASAKEREVELDYGAWRLLRDTLQQAESEDSVHLGKALVDPVSARMSELTAERYGSVDIEPQLQTSGIEFGGEIRGVDDLSIGTQEQLATLLRLSIAETLDSFVILDDQLTQSDSGRIQKIRRILSQAAEKVQVIVFTCRGEDYVYDGGDSGTQTVDLESCVIRRPAAGMGNNSHIAEESAGRE